MFSVPYNKETIESYIKNKEMVDEIYIDSKLFDHESICSIIKDINNIGQKSNILFLDDDMDENYIRDINGKLIHYHHIGLNKITIKNPIVFKLLNEIQIGIDIVLYNENISMEQLSLYYEYGLKEYIIPSKKARNDKFISKIKEQFPNLVLKVMVNDSCDPNCIARDNCYLKSNNGFYKTYLCDKPSNLLKLNLILPTEIEDYKNIDTFIINNNENINMVVDKYFNKDIFEYNLSMLLDKNIIGKQLLLNKCYLHKIRDMKIIKSCNFDCTINNCEYCEKINNEIMDHECDL